ncbi:DUF6541 family protein [Arthrobacter psychrolactophilus]
MTWFETIPTIVAATLVIFVPGAILARAVGIRGLTSLAVAAPLTISLISVGTVAAGFVHLPWSP